MMLLSRDFTLIDQKLSVKNIKNAFSFKKIRREKN